MKRLPLFITLFLLSACYFSSFAAEFSIFPNLPGTRAQTWPVSAYSAGGNCWLVVCEEGFLNEQEKNLYCGRVSSDGQSLDPAAIALCKAADVQENASIASNGADFLVVWQDMRNGTDYDVFGARVTSDGVVLDTAGILIAGGAWNQCAPSVTYAGGRYHVVYQGYSPDTIGKPDSATDALPIGYRVHGATVSSTGVVGENVLLCPGIFQSVFPTAITTGNDVMVCYNMNFRYGQDNLPTPPTYSPATLNLDGTTGAEKRTTRFLYPPYENIATSSRQKIVPLPHTSVAWGDGFALWAMSNKDIVGSNLFNLLMVDASGNVLRNFRVGTGTEGASGTFRQQSVAFDGSQFLVLRDWADPTPQDDRIFKFQVRGMFIPADGNLSDTTSDGLYRKMKVMSNAQTTHCEMEGHCSAGQTGSFLVTYADFNGADDVKVIGVIVTNGTDAEDLSVRERRNPGFSLYPNPFKPSLTISLLGDNKFERIEIYDLSGRMVRAFSLKGDRRANKISWDGVDLHGAPAATGIYLFKCLGEGRQVINRALLLR